MVVSYLEKLQNEFLQDKLDTEARLNNLQIEMKKNIEFIKLLDESSDHSIEAFTPREVNSKNKQKIGELEVEQKSIKAEIEIEQEKLMVCDQKLKELSDVIKAAKSEKISEAKTDDSLNNELYRLTLLETQENERQRISRELHDSTVQNLTALIHKTELCTKLVDMDPVRLKLELVTMSKTLKDIINDTRVMIYNLRPMSFDDIGLDVTMERALDKLSSSSGKNVDFQVEGEPYHINPVIGITLLRICQECCSNALKHSKADIIIAKLKYLDNKIVLSVEDNGVGFDVKSLDTSERKDNSGFGLSMMKERVYLLSGTLNFDSKINQGTKITVEVPASKEEK